MFKVVVAPESDAIKFWTVAEADEGEGEAEAEATSEEAANKVAFAELEALAEGDPMGVVVRVGRAAAESPPMETSVLGLEASLRRVAVS